MRGAAAGGVERAPAQKCDAGDVSTLPSLRVPTVVPMEEVETCSCVEHCSCFCDGVLYTLGSYRVEEVGSRCKK